MEKFRYGSKEIIATVAGAVLIVAARYLHVFLLSSGIMSAKAGEWFQMSVPVIAIVAVFFGPVSGLLCGVGGVLLVNVIFETSISYPSVIVLGLYGFILGLYFGKMHYDPADFSLRTIIDFNAVQITSGILVAMLLLPLLLFLMTNQSLYESVYLGAKQTVGNAVIVGILCPAIMFAVSLVKGRQKKGRRT